MIIEIDNHCIKENRYGFTIPYLYKIEKDAQREKSIYEILNFFTTAEKKYLISFCNDLDEWIIGLPKDENAPIHMYNNFGNLYYDEHSIGEFETLDELAKFMIAKYQFKIDEGKFSKNIETGMWE